MKPTEDKEQQPHSEQQENILDEQQQPTAQYRPIQVNLSDNLLCTCQMDSSINTNLSLKLPPNCANNVCSPKNASFSKSANVANFSCANNKLLAKSIRKLRPHQRILLLKPLLAPKLPSTPRTSSRPKHQMPTITPLAYVHLSSLTPRSKNARLAAIFQKLPSAL